MAIFTKNIPQHTDWSVCHEKTHHKNRRKLAPQSVCLLKNFSIYRFSYKLCKIFFNKNSVSIPFKDVINANSISKRGIKPIIVFVPQVSPQ